MPERRMKRVAVEAKLRRRAFDLIPQMPTDTESAMAVLELIKLIAGAMPATGGDNWKLAIDLCRSLPANAAEAQAIADYALRLWCANLSPEAIEKFIENGGRDQRELRLVR